MLHIDRLHREILEQLDLTEEIEDRELEEIIYRVINRESENTYISLEERAKVGKELFNSFRKLDLLQELLEDDEITEIMINGTANIFVEKKGRIQQLEKHFWSKEKLEDIIQQIVGRTNRLINESHPIVDSRLEDGSRVNVVLHPIALNGPILTIRKFPKENITMERLIQLHSISAKAAKWLEKIVSSRYNIFISGSTGSGKTTFLNVLSEFISNRERIITIEDNAELQIKTIPNLVCLETRNENVEGEGAITVRDLIKSALRMRPDRIIVGEVRGPEAIDMVMAMSTGHDGSISTAHANTPKDMLNRLETMILMGIEIPIEAIRRQLVAAIDIMIHLGRLRDGSRKVLEIAEVIGYESGEIQVQTVFKFVESEVEDESVKGELVHVNNLVHKEKLMAAGHQEL